jgi:hypothetical protein
MRNNYDINGFDLDEKNSFSFNWLGSTVKFKILGIEVVGKIVGCESCDHILTTQFFSGRKEILVKGHFSCFKRVK